MSINTRFRKLLKYILVISLFIICFNCMSIKGYCKNIVVVIDPGHGGDSIGGNMDDRIERDINLKTAKAFKNRLEMYDDVEVYLTRENNTDKEMSRKERFDFAKKVNADFLFSVHYNMSEYHTLYGSEVWVASRGEHYAKGYAFATIELEALSNLGLLNRGIKCRLDNGQTEYYGILKYGEDYNIPSVIIEHCHLDEERDSAFWNDESYELLGKTDADSVAKFFKLSSPSLGIDNSGYENIEVELPTKRLDRDSTEPEYCEIQLIATSDTDATIQISATDSDNYIQYYQYSTDGGKTFSRLETWEDRTSENQVFNISLDYINLDVIVRAYNQYDLYTQSNIISLDAMPEIITETSDDKSTEYKDIDIDYIKVEKNNFSISPITVLLITLFILFLTFNILFFICIGSKKRSRKNRRRRKR